MKQAETSNFCSFSHKAGKDTESFCSSKPLIDQIQGGAKTVFSREFVKVVNVRYKLGAKGFGVYFFDMLTTDLGRLVNPYQ